MAHDNPIEEVLQATPQASGLLFHALKDGNDAYHIGVAFRVKAQAEEAEVREVWRRIQASQPALRSVFAWRAIRFPHQLIHAAPRIPLEYVRVEPGEAPAGQRGLDWLARSKASPFALDEEVFRIACFHDAAAGTLDIAFSFHHILMDGWSSSLLIALWLQGLRGQEIAALDARLYSRQLWQGLAPEELQASREYWDAVFRDLPDGEAAAATRLLAEPMFRRAAAAGSAAAGTTAGSRWDEARKGAVEALCRRAGVTPASFVYLCWALTLSKLSFQKSVAFGCAFSGREAALARSADRQPLGLFTNTAPLILTLDGGWNAAAALRAVFQTLQRTQRHEKSPPLLVREAAGQRGELYDSLVVFDNYPIDASLRDAGCGAHVEALHSEETTHFGLTLTVSGVEQWQVELSASAASEADPAAVRAAFHAFESLAADLLAAPETATIGELALKLGPDGAAGSLVAGERNEQTPDINALLRRIGQRLADFPEAVGLIEGERRIANRELAQGIRAVQEQLRSAGFVPGDRVGVHLDKGLRSTQAILAILFSGGSYVYLNPKDPPQRKRMLLALADCGIVLCGGLAQADLGADAGRLLLDIEAAAPAAGGAAPWLWPKREAGSEFYFIFTSGTTGRPKGISVRDESAANLLDWFVRETGLSAADRVLGLTDLNFDPSVEDLFASLAVGAVLIYPAPEALRERQAFIDVLRGQAVTLVNFIPGAIAQLIHGAPRLPDMRLWIFGGEALPAPLRDELLGQGYAVSNHYGPSETTVDCLSARQSPEREVAIGWPIQNAVAFCADVFGQALPAGVRGELWVGGLSIARGYAGNPAESAKSFVERDGQAYYRTGDAVTFAPDLGFRYLGRIDDQVKVNGVRIEPRELERVVEAMAEVRACSLLPAPTPEGKRQWSLFVDSAMAAETLLPLVRERIRSQLPEAWMPARIVAVDGFERTLTGKIDRNRLLQRAELQEQAAPAPALATDPVEAKVQQVWRAVLDGRTAATDVNFFDAGGDSIKIIALQSGVRQAFDREVGVAVLFEHPTIASFSDWIRRDGAPAASSSHEHQLSSAQTGKSRLADRRRKAKGSSAS
ncbi:AMP-binding protein [Chromobacterium subtsugae]|uniref:AMP-binding protein n=1 Tax=Chromobacterium subtsugae TaxID=251747 RepID=UPI00064165EB|nr:AMP-binding protein [Chromobacterium subtsugae]